MSPDEQRLLRLYGKMPTKKDLLQNKLKEKFEQLWKTPLEEVEPESDHEDEEDDSSDDSDDDSESNTDPFL